MATEQGPGSKWKLKIISYDAEETKTEDTATNNNEHAMQDLKQSAEDSAISKKECKLLSREP